MSEPLASAVYEGRVHHERVGPRRHRFGYGLYMLYLDLAELDRVFEGRWFWSTERFNVVQFRRSDYLGDPDVPLDRAVRDRVEQELGERPRGPVRMLTHLRTFGYCFNPVTFYYCFDEQGREVESVVAEITNTPWGERHAYVLGRRSEPDARELAWRFPKTFHVSPFFDMDYDYVWDFTPPAGELRVRMHNVRGTDRAFTAALAMKRRELGARTLAWALVRHPFMTWKVHVAIYWQALRLWWKRTPFFTHPRKRADVAPASES